MLPPKMEEKAESSDSGGGSWAELQRESEADHQSMTRRACLNVGVGRTQWHLSAPLLASKICV